MRGSGIHLGSVHNPLLLRYGQLRCTCSSYPQRPWSAVGLGALPTFPGPLNFLQLPSPALMRFTASLSGHTTSGPATCVSAK